jgi:5'-phosphate synthase pdxT subunit
VPTVGVLAIQGDFYEHRQALSRLGVNSREVRVRGQLSGIDGLIIPGGESTTIVQLIDKFQLREALVDEVHLGLPVWGTCAGMIVLANRLTEPRPSPLSLMDIEVSRNAFGRQVHSFEQNIDIDGVQGPPFPAIFIRAPIVKSYGSMVKILASIENGFPVAVRQGHIFATSFHPELTNDDRIHRLFMDMIEETG